MISILKHSLDPKSNCRNAELQERAQKPPHSFPMLLVKLEDVINLQFQDFLHNRLISFLSEDYLFTSTNEQDMRIYRIVPQDQRETSSRNSSITTKEQSDRSSRQKVLIMEILHISGDHVGPHQLQHTKTDGPLFFFRLQNPSCQPHADALPTP